jgi:Na+:H+ antiporter, NhaC family
MVRLPVVGNRSEDEAGRPSVQLSVGVISAVAGILIVGSVGLGAPIELSMFVAMVTLMLIVYTRGFTFVQVQNAAFDAIRKIIELVFILFTVGMLISTWAQSGTIPFIIRYGLEIIDPSWFYIAVILLCSATSLVTGTSWGTMGSVGVAMMAVGQGLEMPAALTAGAVISGAYFGDKLSILSDSTNLAAAITNTPILTHIRYMLITTVPAYLLTLITFGIIGALVHTGGDGTGPVDQTIAGLESAYSFGWYSLLPVGVLIVMLFFRLPPFIAIFSGAVAAGFVAMATQGATATEVVESLHSGYISETGQQQIDELVSGGGLLSMAGLAMLFIFAVGTSGLLNQGGFVKALLDVFVRWATTRRRLMALTSPVMIIALAIGASLSFAAVMVGTLFTPAYQDKQLRSENLSRTIEDSGTVYDAFFPWSGGGVFAAGALGVMTLEYMPFMFFAFFSTLMSILVALTQFKVRTLQSDGAESEPLEIAASSRA